MRVDQSVRHVAVLDATGRRMEVEHNLQYDIKSLISRCIDDSSPAWPYVDRKYFRFRTFVIGM